MKKLQFKNDEQDNLFLTTLRGRVNEYFKKSDLKKTGNKKSFIKAIMLNGTRPILGPNHVYICIFDVTSSQFCSRKPSLIRKHFYFLITSNIQNII